MPMTARLRHRLAASAAVLASLIGGATALAPAASAASTGATVQSASRSTGVVFANSTGQQLLRTESGLSHGCWSRDSLPPDAIAKRVTASWASESCGFATGTEGWTTYRIANTLDEVTIRWNNPYVGSNSYSCSAPNGYDCNRSGGGGNNATVTFTLTQRNASKAAGPAANDVAAKADLTASAQRSTRVTLVNQSGALLARTGASLNRGIWSPGENFPPSLINNASWARWQSESEGFATGTEGTAEYTLSGGGKVVIHWNNPYVGSNSYDCQVPADHHCSRAGGSGNNANVVFTVS